MYSMRDYEYDKQKKQKKYAPENAVVLQSEVDDVDSIEAPTRKKLKRDIKAEALERLEQAARTPEDFEEVIEWWDRLDRNRERRERYREISRNDVDFPLEWGEAAWGTVFPKNLNTIIAKQIRKGDFIDFIFDNPYEIHELVTEEYLCRILRELKDEHKELLYLIAIKGLSTTEIAKLQEKSDRAVRYMRDTVFNKIRRKAYDYLTSEQGKKHDMTLSEKKFVENYKKNE